jgi:hypothetical protein
VGHGLTPDSYAAVVADAEARLSVPDGPPRRTGSIGRIAENIEQARGDLADNLKDASDLERVAELCLELGSCLYDAGAPHPLWRYWTGLAGLGLVLQDRPEQACAYLVLAGQWDTVASLVAGPPASGPLARRCLWVLAGGSGGERLREGRIGEWERAWPDLVEAVPAGDQGRVTRDLTELAEFWIGESDNWNAFAPRSYPSFHPEVCAAAAITRRSGTAPADLSGDVALFLEPGLAAGTPDTLPGVAPR